MSVIAVAHYTRAPIEAHQALFYRGSGEYLEGISDFIEPALDRDEPVAIAVPAPKLEFLRGRLGRRASKIEMLDMFELGRNPGRIIPAVLLMIERYGNRPLRYVGEPIWAGRSRAEIREATRHEALINLAWPDADIRVLCPYDAASLDDHVLAEARRTHPGIVHDGELQASPSYGGPTVPPACEHPLSDPPPGALGVRFDIGDLGRIRVWVAERVAESAVSRGVCLRACARDQRADHEHGQACGHPRGPAVLAVAGRADLPGRRLRPHRRSARGAAAATAGTGGLGLWMVNQLCDLVEIRTSAAGTTIRVHSAFARPPREQLGAGACLAG